MTDETADERSLGIMQKYRVSRTTDDGSGKHDDCRYFVMDPQHDPMALEAMLTYATVARETGFQALYDELMDWLAACSPPSLPAVQVLPSSSS